ncbi:(2,3-dihydroxybenzoyl)adenylate synthase [Methylomonas sp. OY6]|uniref:(2,3-dihydroxybenzoyl)adenylate synthase n=1 Tax=Methylomonas defluvii TaxID=3045149 RepID=A0ABU4UKT5_9GAMM|nr:(2,3-dihydroxybenzoyl)adenylate synthase [Methylomonas sp. OY6]MDX8130023.1 (2,3-dihydroxybenzoyl)adenylate synthase [Methylomonas sp. OY6]
MTASDFTPWPDELVRSYREQGWWQNQTLGALLRESAQRYGERIALVCGARRWSYRELDERADQLATGFAQLGLRTGERVVVQLPNIAEFFAVCFGCFRLGLIPVLALPGHRRAEIAAFCQLAEAAAYVIPDRHDGYDYRLLARETLALAPCLRHVIVAGAAEEFVPLQSLYVKPLALPDQDPAAVALLQLSGGSTGTPKLIPRTHDDYLYSVRTSVDICGFDAATVYLAALPVAHNFPLSSPGTLGTLYSGGRIVLLTRPEPDAAFTLIAAEAVSHLALVPSLLLAWLERATSLRPPLGSLRLVQVGGASLAAEVAARIKPVFGCALQQVFGMAEGLVTYTRLDDDPDVVLETQGRPMSPGDEIRIVDDEDRVLADGETGHLLTRGPYTIRGYWRADEHNRKAFTVDGFYRTGDLVRRRADGSLQVMGRSKDQINRAGEKIAAAEVEQHLLSHPRVRNAALVAIPDERLGERSCAFVELAEPDSDEAPARIALGLKLYLRDHCGLAAHKIPDRIEFIDRLPLTAPGKIAKPQLRALALNLTRTPT